MKLKPNQVIFVQYKEYVNSTRTKQFECVFLSKRSKKDANKDKKNEQGRYEILFLVDDTFVYVYRDQIKIKKKATMPYEKQMDQIVMYREPINPGPNSDKKSNKQSPSKKKSSSNRRNTSTHGLKRSLSTDDEPESTPSSDASHVSAVVSPIPPQKKRKPNEGALSKKQPTARIQQKTLVINDGASTCIDDGATTTFDSSSSTGSNRIDGGSGATTTGDSSNSTGGTTNNDVEKQSIQLQYEGRSDELDGSNDGTNGSKRTLNDKSLSNTIADDNSNTNGSSSSSSSTGFAGNQSKKSIDNIQQKTLVLLNDPNTNGAGNPDGSNVRTTASKGSDIATNNIGGSNGSNKLSVLNGSTTNNDVEKKSITQQNSIEDKSLHGSNGSNGSNGSSSNGSTGSTNSSTGSNGSSGSSVSSDSNEAVASHYEIMIRRNVEEIDRLNIMNTNLVHEAKGSTKHIKKLEGIRSKLEERLGEQDQEQKNIQLVQQVVNQHVTTISQRDATIEKLKMKLQQWEEEIGKEQQNIDKARQNMLKFKTKLDKIFSSYEEEMEVPLQQPIKM